MRSPGLAFLAPLSHAPKGVLVDLDRFLEHVGIDAGDPIRTGAAKRRRLVLGDVDEDVFLAPLFIREHAARRVALAQLQDGNALDLGFGVMLSTGYFTIGVQVKEPTTLVLPSSS